MSGLVPPEPLPPTHAASAEEDRNRKTGGSEGSVNSQDSSHPFREGPQIKQLVRRVSGFLTRRAIEEVERLLAQGLEGNQTVGLAPVMLRYLRLHCGYMFLGGTWLRELLILPYTIDRLLQRDVLAALDIIMQRVKSLGLVKLGSEPLKHAARGSPGGIQEAASMLPGRVMEDYPFSSVLLCGELLKILRGRGCGFGDAVSNFCQTSPLETAEKKSRKSAILYFPLAPTQQQ